MTIGKLNATVVQIRVPLGHLWVIIINLKVTLGHFKKDDGEGHL